MGPRMTAARLALAVSAAIVLAGCGSSSSKSSSTPATTSSSPASPTTNASATSPGPVRSRGNFDSCSVVTQDEAASAIRQPVSPGVLGNATVEGGVACRLAQGAGDSGQAFEAQAVWWLNDEIGVRFIRACELDNSVPTSFQDAKQAWQSSRPPHAVGRAFPRDRRTAGRRGREPDARARAAGDGLFR